MKRLAAHETRTAGPGLAGRRRLAREGLRCLVRTPRAGTSSQLETQSEEQRRTRQCFEQAFHRNGPPLHVQNPRQSTPGCIPLMPVKRTKANAVRAKSETGAPPFLKPVRPAYGRGVGTPRRLAEIHQIVRGMCTGRIIRQEGRVAAGPCCASVRQAALMRRSAHSADCSARRRSIAVGSARTSYAA